MLGPIPSDEFLEDMAYHKARSIHINPATLFEVQCLNWVYHRISRAVLRRHHQEGLFLGVKPTKSGRKRKSPLESLLSGVHRTYLGHGQNFVF